MITEIYRDYFQKSYTFLYPCLGFSKKKDPKPEYVYMFWPEHSSEPYKLYCLFKRDNTEKWKHFEKNRLITHTMLDECIEIDDQNIIYVFDLGCFSADYDCVLNGKYSKLSIEIKKIITDYYGVHTPEWVYIESFLYPGKYFSKYAEILKVDVDMLKEVGELCSPYDKTKETFSKEVLISQ